MLRREISTTLEALSPLELAHLEPLIELSIEAGKGIAKAQLGELRITRKADASPVSHADEEADALIVAGLKQYAPAIPIVSEEGAPGTPEALQKGRFWLVDPLDGTSGYIRGKPEYTVNIALIEDGEPVLGVVYLPATEECFAGIVGKGAFKREHGHDKAIQVRSAPEAGWDILLSHRGATEEIRHMLRDYPIGQLQSAASSLKFCRVAEGVADAYPRIGPTSEWDTAAGHAILRAAGGEVYALPVGKPLRYAKPRFLNGYFIAVGGVSLDASRLIEELPL